MGTRLKCSSCGRTVDPEQVRVVESPDELPFGHRVAEKLRKAEGLPLEYVGKPFHSVMRSRGAGGGRIGCRTWVEHCGPVETVELDPYIEQMEALIGCPMV